MRKKFMRFPEGKTKAVTLSYDDNIEEDQHLITLMEKYQMKGTFNLIPGWFAKEGTIYPEDETYRLVSASMAKKMYDHSLVEVANHGYTHKYMSTLTTMEMTQEVLKCRNLLEEMYGTLVRGMAYPYGWHSEALRNVLSLCGITYCRTVNSTRNFELPQNWLEWNPTCHHDDPQLMELTEKFVKGDVAESPQLFYLWGHTFEFERNNNWQVMEQFMKTVSSRQDIWYAANGEIYDYVKAYEALIYSADGKRIVNPSRQPVWIAIDDITYEIKDQIVLD